MNGETGRFGQHIDLANNPNKILDLDIDVTECELSDFTDYYKDFIKYYNDKFGVLKISKGLISYQY